jgi:hypothetical protein
VATLLPLKNMRRNRFARELARHRMSHHSLAEGSVLTNAACRTQPESPTEK